MEGKEGNRIYIYRGGGAGPADRAAAGPIFLIVGGGAPRGLEHVGR